MITLVKYGNNFNQLVLILSGLSTDNKPTGTYIERDDIGTVVAIKVIPNGSIFNEIDTGNIYQYDKENQTWNKTSGGGGGGSSTLIEKSVSTNGVYNASDDSADGYSKVTVSVPNTYVAEDEGKVVNNSALVSQTAMSSDITENGTVDTTLYNSVTVNVASGGSATRNDVRFLDYDGTIVQTYSAADFANLTELPANPSHTGLTAQGWNWSLADAKNYVASYGKLDIGQMYASNTTDGKTYLHIRLGEGRLKPYLGLTGNSSGTAVSINWGDGSATESVILNSSTVYTPHEYTSDGEYVINITVTSGTIGLYSISSNTILFRKSSSAYTNEDKAYANILTKAELGIGVTAIGNYAFSSCYSLTSITISSSVTSIGQYAFQNCPSLTSITIPSEVTSIGKNAFQNCYSLTSITIPSEVTSIEYGTFSGCYSLTSITIPSEVTSIGSTAFNGCYSLTSITIPSEVTSIGYNVLSGCHSLTSIIIPSSVTSIGDSLFQNCYSLTSVTILSSVTFIGNNTFNSCYSLTSVTIPSEVTSIGYGMFQSCYSLTSITIPSEVTSIGYSAFNSAYGLGFIKFEPTSPPSVSNANAWNFIPTDCIIYVPTGSLTAYTSAANYPDPNTYTYVEY